MTTSTRCPYCQRGITAAVCTCLAASVAAPARPGLYEAAIEPPHIEIQSTTALLSPGLQIVAPSTTTVTGSMVKWYLDGNAYGPVPPTVAFSSRDLEKTAAAYDATTFNLVHPNRDERLALIRHAVSTTTSA